MTMEFGWLTTSRNGKPCDRLKHTFLFGAPGRISGGYAARLSSLRSSVRTQRFALHRFDSSGRKKWGPDGSPCFFGAPGRIRTSDRLVRSQVLYPAELRALCSLRRGSPRKGAHLTDLTTAGKAEIGCFSADIPAGVQPYSCSWMKRAVAEMTSFETFSLPE